MHGGQNLILPFPHSGKGEGGITKSIIQSPEEAVKSTRFSGIAIMAGINTKSSIERENS